MKRGESVEKKLGKAKMNKMNPFGVNPNSILGRANKATKALIRKKRREADADLRSMERWARSGFGPTGGDEVEGRQLYLDRGPSDERD